MYYEIAARIELLIEKDKLDLAQQQLNDALSQFPDAGVLHQLQSEVYFRLQRYNDAMEAANRAIAADPDDDYGFYLKARIYISEQKLKDADEEIDRALALNPYRADYYGVKATIKLDRSKPAEAAELAEKGLEIDPANLFCNNVLSMAHSRMGKKDRAYERLEYMLANDPENAFTHANAGFHFLRQGQVKKAKEHFSTALQIDPNQAYAKSGMAEAIKSTNIVYRKLLQFSLWIEKIGRNKLILWVGVIILINLLPILIPFYMVFILWTWFTPPIANILLNFDRYGRYLLDDDDRMITKINFGLLVVAVALFVSAIFLTFDFLLLGFAFFITMLPVYHLTDAKKQKRLILIGFAVAFIGVGLTAWTMAFLLGMPQAGDWWVALAVMGMLFTWIV